MRKLSCNITGNRVGPFVNLLRTIGTQHRWHKPDGIDTGIRIYNCIAGRKVPLIMANENFLSWYTCGPTVYDISHIGHASCYVKLDIIQRILRHHFNINVVSAMNITDIDDKIIRKSLESGRDWREISRFYEREFWSDLRKLNILEPDIKLRVTDNITKITDFVTDLLRKNYAYVGKDSSVYFYVKQFPSYGKLQNINLTEDNPLQPGNKISSMDFALWKASKSDSEPSWPSPWGSGRPGWHIECSTLGTQIFGKSIDIHAGGIDLRFPHHENEEVQSCVYHNSKQWVNYWLHTGHLHIKGDSEKMSKSLKNTVSISEMLKNFSADDFRMACALSNYKNSMDFSNELMETAKNTLNKFKTFNSDCRAYLCGKKIGSNFDGSAILQNLKYARSNIETCLRDDFDTSHSINILLDQISSISRCINSTDNYTLDCETSSCLNVIAAVNNYVESLLQSFGFRFAELKSHQEIEYIEKLNVNFFLDDILNTRHKLRVKAVKAKNKELFQICDDLRNCLREHKIEISDHDQGSSWRFVSDK